MKPQFLKINNKKVGYYDVGKGQSILLLPGWSACKESFLPFISKLKNKYRLIAIDLPGHGDSEPLDSKHNLKNHVKFLEDFIRVLDIKKLNIFGTSLGGTLALEFALSNQSFIENLIVQAPIFSKIQLREGKVVSKFLTNPYLHPIISLFTKFSYFRKKYFEKFSLKRLNEKVPVIKKHAQPEFRKEIDLHVKKIFDIYNNHTDSRALVESGFSVIFIDMEKKLKNLDVKTLILWGEKDEMLDFKWSKQLSKLIKNSNIIPIKDATHFVIMEKPYVLAIKVDNFIENSKRV